MAKRSGNAIGNFFKSHIEKIIFGTAILALGGPVFFSMSTEDYKSSPSKLANENDLAKSYMERVDAWDNLEDFRKVETEAPKRIVASEKSPLEYDKYAFDRILGTRIATLGQRLDPELKAPFDLMAVQVSAPIVISGRYSKMVGLLEIIEGEKEKAKPKRSSSGDDGDDDGEFGEGGGDSSEEEEGPESIPASLRNVALLNPEAQQWDSDKVNPVVRDSLCVLGLVPHEAQWKEFDSKLRDAQGWYPLRDRPDYKYMEIQRRADGGEWVDVTDSIENISANVYAPYKIEPEFAEPKYLHPVLSQKIPPFLGFDYRKVAVHPKTELYQFFDEPVAKLMTLDAADVDSEDDPENPFGVDPNRAEREKAEPENEIRDDRMNEGGATELGQLGTTGPKMSGQKELEAERLQDRPSSKYKLIRFFDPTVSQGVAYEYRVRVWIADPNNPHGGSSSSGGGGNGLDRPEGAGGALDAPSSGAGGAGAGVGGDFEMGGKSGGGLDGGSGGEEETGGSLADIKLTPLLDSMKDQLVRDRIRSQKTPEYIKSLPNEDLAFARPTPWSEPTTAVTVRATPAEVLAGSAKRRMSSYGTATLPASDPSMQMVVTKFDKTYNVKMPTVRNVFPGDLLNFESSSKFAHPIEWTLHEKKNVQFDSDSVVVGIQGGDRKTYYVGKQGERRLQVAREGVAYTTPGEILILDRDGNMIVRNEFDDLNSYRKSIFEPDEPIYGKPRIKEPDEDEDEEGGRGRGRGRGGDGF